MNLIKVIIGLVLIAIGGGQYVGYPLLTGYWGIGALVLGAIILYLGLKARRN